MILALKKINLILKKKNINFFILAKYLIYIFQSFKNYFKYYINSETDNLYIPNLAIKNIIYINPKKIKYINSIPMKFSKSTKFISNFNWYENNKNLEVYDHPTYTTCNELFIEGKKIEECKNFLNYKYQIENKKTFKNINNHKDLINFFNKKIDLFKSLKKFGVKKNSLFNIQLMIDKNINLVKINSGNHRFFISKILNLESIPVEIKLIHLESIKKINDGKISIKQLNNFIKNVEANYR